MVIFDLILVKQLTTVQAVGGTRRQTWPIAMVFNLDAPVCKSFDGHQVAGSGALNTVTVVHLEARIYKSLKLSPIVRARACKIL